MPCGLFGKLPAKRDFVSAGAPPEFLAVYEPWLQGGLTASRLELGAGWQNAFLEAPIWRFWLGGAWCGTPVAGAFMPSVDGSGRYFPLTVVATADAGSAIPPPELDPQEGWFGLLEDFLLKALHPDLGYDDLLAALERLPPPVTDVGLAPPADMARLSGGTIVSALDNATFPARLTALRIEDHARSFARTTCLWTMGGESFEPLVLVGQEMPSPYLFAGLLTGRFERALA